MDYIIHVMMVMDYVIHVINKTLRGSSNAIGIDLLYIGRPEGMYF